MSEMTTIKVPKAVRDSFMKGARAAGLPAAAYLELLTQEHERNRRFDEVRRAYEPSEPDGDYAEITAAWSESDSDGLKGL